MRLRILVVALVAGAAAAAAAGVPSSDRGRLTGDEPHYVITAISLFEDGDLDVSDEYEGDRYRAFHRSPRTPQAWPAEDGSMVEPHDPLLPAILAVPVGLWGWLGARFAGAVAAALLAGTLLWLAEVRFGVPARGAAVVAVLTASAPIAMYGAQVYPELWAALVLTAGLAAVTGHLRVPGLAVCTLAVVALPWLSVKYAPVAAVLALWLLGRLLAAGRWGQASAVILALALGAVGFALGHLAWYGGLTPYAAGRYFLDAGEFSVVGRSPNLAGRSVRLAGLLTDREFGLLVWQPAWLALIPATAAFARRRPPHAVPVIALLATGWLVATFVALTMHGWWFPGRQLVVVLPLGALAVAWWASSSVGRMAAVVVAGVLGVVTYAWVVAEAYAGELTMAVDPFATSAPAAVLLRPFLPGYRSATTGTWALHVAWTAAFVVLAVWGWRRAAWRPGETTSPGLDAISSR